MSRRLFFVPEISRGRAELRGDDAKHLTRVLRVEIGQRYHISDNHALYLAEVEAARKDLVVFSILEKLEAPQPAVAITVLPALIKFDRFEWMLEKATELGVLAVVPVETVRTEKGLGRGAVSRMERWRRIVLESSQQSRRVFLPEIAIPVPFTRALEHESPHRYFLEEHGGAPPILSAIPAVRDSKVALLIGPEGGWTGEERAQAMARGWSPVSLGPQVLRAETAAIAALAILSAAWQQPS